MKRKIYQLTKEECKRLNNIRDEIMSQRIVGDAEKIWYFWGEIGLDRGFDYKTVTQLAGSSFSAMPYDHAFPCREWWCWPIRLKCDPIPAVILENNRWHDYGFNEWM